MERQKLIRLMAGDDDMRVAVREALAAGAGFQVWDDSRVPVPAAMSILRRRQASAERRGTSLLNFAEAIDALTRYTGDTVMVGRVGDREHNAVLFQLYLNPETEAVICCLGVRPSS
ncbi:hypothetical protein GCM10010170_011380 [Dactylosporangium salmoneum]|uniref:SnoaL-like domain-containing protein n=2 Tax=Dactylosporangium salmoneum TaxID=53361 RepID=A0ABP5SJ81_9ACTN